MFEEYGHEQTMLLCFSGLREATEGIIKKKQTKALSPWEEYLQKKKDKKERKREERTNKQERIEQQLEVSISLFTGVISKCPTFALDHYVKLKRP